MLKKLNLKKILLGTTIKILTITIILSVYSFIVVNYYQQQGYTFNQSVDIYNQNYIYKTINLIFSLLTSYLAIRYAAKNTKHPRQNAITLATICILIHLEHILNNTPHPIFTTLNLLLIIPITAHIIKTTKPIP